MILLITNKDDVTTDFIVNHLNKVGANYYRLNTEYLLTSVSVNFDVYNNEYSLIDHKKNKIINLSVVKSVYYRRPVLPQIKIDSLSDGENAFIVREIAYLLEGLYKILDDRFWISQVSSIREAENKVYQLRLARKIGLEIPASLITTSRVKAEAFLEHFKGDCIIKPIKNGRIDNHKNPMVVFTSPITCDDISLLDGVKNCPTYFQNRIEKTADIRVTVVGEKVFSAIIYSQEFKETMIDWRNGENINIRHERIKLPSHIESKCIELINILGLNFGAIDFVLDKDMRYIFLEINPNGQWGWIEKRLGYNISSEIVRLLLKRGHKE
jgi:glutathione synthase/RimK-type ligase-like ATP-grasp enzyme